ncbi:Gfo/Idh/MocA family protein [Methanomethylophilus alvi]|uniref:Gfo/Idh/MocA family protein n=1 Tax=Methanomethylophilus alvi TaxID=1291540 RepID=UPI0037DC621D
MFNAAIIGISGFGAVHYNDFLREHAAGRIHIVGATVINQEEEAQKCAFLRSIGCRLFTDYREMLRELSGKIDICFIPTGIALHAPMTIDALESGANVYVEKPIAATLQEVDRMREAERRTGKFIAVGYQSMYQPETRRIKEMLLAGRIGKITTLKSYSLWPRDSVYYHRNNWAGKLRNGSAWVLDSPFTNAVAHYLNLLSFYAGNSFEGIGEIESVQAGLFRANPVETNDTAWIRGVMRGGAQLLFYSTHCSDVNEGPISEIQGELGSITYASEKVEIQYKNGEREEFPMTPGDKMRANIYTQLIQRLQDPAAFICTAEIAAGHTRICNAVFDSVRCVELPESAFRVETNAKGAVRRVILGIDDVIRAAYRENRLPDTRDFPWAVNGEPFAMEGYHAFSGAGL